MKYINFKRYKFSTVTKKFNFSIRNFLKTFKFMDFGRYDFKKLKRYLDIQRLYSHLNFKKLYTYLQIKKYSFYKINKKLNLRKFKKLYAYFASSVFFLTFVYIATPIFYKYDKSSIENIICKSKNLNCLINGSVNYVFYPTPRIKVKELTIYNYPEKKRFIIIDETEIKLSLKNLINKNKQIYTKIIFNNFKINFDSKNLGNYKKIFIEENTSIPIRFKNGEAILLDKDNKVASISNANLNVLLKEDLKKIIIKGKFLNDNLHININTKKIENKLSTKLVIKMSKFDLLTKVNLFSFVKDKESVDGDILIKKNKQRFTGIFNYKNNEITISKSNVRNIFLDGKLNGSIKFLPYFNFDLDLDLNSINFTKLYNHFLAIGEKNQKNLFEINKKINGNLNVSADRIYSSYNLIKSFESRLKFNNGNISIEQFLFNLGKLGAADLLGEIKNDEKFTHFKYESNIFVDNQKKFLSKFGIYNKDNISSNIFISGNFDLKNIKASFYEISDVKKLNDENINFIEQEFNDYMLVDGYKSLFRFPKFKEFIKSVTNNEN